ncbi:hypothetical protein M8C21_012771 [Ambrosia artemisiifolia]|uniref:Uncharacterized protein n=1 Tax=Ambrosia artemisiifolia TaxID=4212 RepID=A0AAD5GP11_AMBAR|nr:hypothetical protein M8C21_012771 [Ambrosia artemisiifolia]
MAASYDWKRKRISQTPELKYMKRLSTNDEPFQLSSMEIRDIIRIILSRNTPTPETYAQWDEYAISFYLKMCTCYGVDYQHLEAASPDEMDLEKHIKSTLMTQPSTKKMSYEKKPIEQHMESTLMTQPSTTEMSDEEELIEQLENKVITGVRVFLKAPFETGCYSPEPPDRIPYHLYLLVKEAVDYMKNPNDLIDLERVERKIQFFCKYFHSHLPTGWN